MVFDPDEDCVALQAYLLLQTDVVIIGSRAGFRARRPGTFGNRNGLFLREKKRKKLLSGRGAWYFSTKITILNPPLIERGNRKSSSDREVQCFA
jgi:hypothetical protein